MLTSSRYQRHTSYNTNIDAYVYARAANINATSYDVNANIRPALPIYATDPLYLTIVIPTSINVGQIAAVNVNLNNIPVGATPAPNLPVLIIPRWWK